MNILILGSGGREHTLAWKVSQSPLCGQLFIAPGNAGTQQHGKNVNLDPSDFTAVLDFVKKQQVHLLLVGPEAPLVAGITDFLAEHAPEVKVVGPTKTGALLEGSKEFAKAFMQRHGIPTAQYGSFTLDQLSDGLKYMQQKTPPIVLKADGLAAGKGVLICENHEDAERELRQMLEGKFGEASSTVVIEDYLDGIEFSVFAITDGLSYQLLPVAKDYKRIGEGDTGLNTGGMGSVSPVPFVDEDLMHKVIKNIVEPTIRGIASEDIGYRGFVFFGLIAVQGEPFVIEYNCRMGDPETQTVIPRLSSDLVALCLSLFDGSLATQQLHFDDRYAIATVLVSGGYPGSYKKGKQITMAHHQESMLFHAGTRWVEGRILTNGGRVLAVTSFGDDLLQALHRSQLLAEEIEFDGKYFRRDIGFDL